MNTLVDNAMTIFWVAVLLGFNTVLAAQTLIFIFKPEVSYLGSWRLGSKWCASLFTFWNKPDRGLVLAALALTIYAWVVTGGLGLL